MWCLGDGKVPCGFPAAAGSSAGRSTYRCPRATECLAQVVAAVGDSSMTRAAVQDGVSACSASNPQLPSTTPRGRSVAGRCVGAPRRQVSTAAPQGPNHRGRKGSACPVLTPRAGRQNPTARPAMPDAADRRYPAFDDEVRFEADAMADCLRGRDVPADRIVRDDRCVGTTQNLRSARPSWTTPLPVTESRWSPAASTSTARPCMGHGSNPNLPSASARPAQIEQRGLWPEVRSEPRAERFRLERPHDHEVAIGPDDTLVLAPSADVWPHVRVNCDGPHRRTGGRLGGGHGCSRPPCCRVKKLWRALHVQVDGRAVDPAHTVAAQVDALRVASRDDVDVDPDPVSGLVHDAEPEVRAQRLVAAARGTLVAACGRQQAEVGDEQGAV